MRTARCNLNSIWLIGFLLIGLCACQPADIFARYPATQSATVPSLVASSDPATLELPYHPEWQAQCRLGLWPALMSADLPGAAEEMGLFIPVNLADPTLTAFLRQVTRTLCAPPYPYRATIRYTVDSHAVHYVVETLSAQQYILYADGNPPCLRDHKRVFRQVETGWSEVFDSYQIGCDHTLQLLILPFLWATPQTGSIEGQLIVEPQQRLAGRLTNVYTTHSEYGEKTDPIRIRLWLDVQSNFPVQIEFLEAGPFPQFQITFEQNIPVACCPLPPD